MLASRRAVIAGFLEGCHCGLEPQSSVCAWHWIPDQVRDDNCRSGMTIAASGMTTAGFLEGCHCGLEPQSSVCAALDPGSGPG